MSESDHLKSAVTKAAAIAACKGQKHLNLVTAYDYPTARVLDEAGVDLLLIGDSLGMMILGYPDTTQVTLADMVHHTAPVARAAKRALVVSDMPINTYDTPEMALETARALVDAGADAVKLEGGLTQEAKIAAITAAGIPVVGHIGLLPQSILKEGGYKIKGKTPEEAELLLQDVAAVNRAGVCCIVIEGTRPEVAAQLTAASAVPTLGIGCGAHTCDGDVAVIHDICGLFPWFVPGFIKPYANLAGMMKHAVTDWMNQVYTAPGQAGPPKPKKTL